MKKIMVIGALFLGVVVAGASVSADDSLNWNGKISSGGVQGVGFLAFEVQTGSGALFTAHAEETFLTENALESLALVPAWLRPDLRDAFSRVTAPAQETMAALLQGITDRRIIDEVAFTLARLSPESIEVDRAYLDVLVENAEWIYLLDEELAYVELVETGDPATDDDFSTTARYIVLDEGVETTYTLPAPVYYWYVAHPIIDCSDRLQRIEPASGFSSESGAWWRGFYYEDSAAGDGRRPAVLTSPNDITDAELSSYDFGGPSALSTFTGPERSMAVVIRETGSLAPVFISFVHGDGRCCNANYPNPDGQVFATTMPVEAAAAAGDDELLENMILAGQGNRRLRDNILLSDDLTDTAARRILVLRDRMPFDLAADPVETLLTTLGREYDVLTSADLASLELTTTEAPFVPSDYIKIIVPSDQPLALYQALSDNAARLEQFVDHGGVLQFHGAVRAADDWTSLTMPLGLAALPMDGTHATDTLEVAGFPALDETIRGAAFLWDRQSAVLSGERAFDPSEGAITRVGWWVAANLPWNVAEMVAWSRNYGLLRRSDPLPLLTNHYGNCGEIQDVYCAALRTLLIPCAAASSFADDHVWNEFFDDDTWHPLQVDWSGGVTRIDTWGVAADADTGGGKTLSGMVSHRGDCLIHNVLGRYEPEVDDSGIILSGDYSYYVTLRIAVLDRADRPVDGARILVATTSFYDPASLSVCTWAYTGPDGIAEFTVGETNAYYAQVESPLGALPDPDHVDLIVQESGTTEPGAVIEHTFRYDGNDPSGLPFPTVPVRAVTEAAYTPPADTEPRWAMDVAVTAGRELAYGSQPFGLEQSWMEPAASARLGVYVMDQANYALFTEGLEASAVWLSEDAAEANFSLDLFSQSGTWYLVVASPDRVTSAREVSVTVTSTYRDSPVEEPWPEADVPDVPDNDAAPDAEADVDEAEVEAEGGCGCAVIG